MLLSSIADAVITAPLKSATAKATPKNTLLLSLLLLLLLLLQSLLNVKFSSYSQHCISPYQASAIAHLQNSIMLKPYVDFLDKFRFLGNCPPTPPISWHQHLLLT